MFLTSMVATIQMFLMNYTGCTHCATPKLPKVVGEVYKTLSHVKPWHYQDDSQGMVNSKVHSMDSIPYELLSK